ncbi:hypothetical protein HZU83_02095 [Sphaerotilus montanus]|uniref:Uncharacterized protein n=1 Tax=Sphaerotilus montanus TaxID=522889 RepID=A0A7Y9R198_9BURK|nr:hypothetical protein [Sphaerotilus montanus]NYG34938.1 hypothetical protein [Sphaerotilus montanus]NZD55466.1 hypothetical protein [Sphaerotilus montanus]
MNAQQHVRHPFALMINAQDVLAAMECSERLQHLQRRICRPLDKPLIPHALSDLELYDRSIDAGLDSTEPDQD